VRPIIQQKLCNMRTRLVCYLLILLFGSNCFHNSTILISSSYINTNNDVGIEEIQNENDLKCGIFKLKSTFMKELIVLSFLNFQDVFMLRSTCKFFQDLVIIEENEIKSICDEPMVNGLSFRKNYTWYKELSQKNWKKSNVTESTQINGSAISDGLPIIPKRSKQILLSYLNSKDMFMLRSTCKSFLVENELDICDEPMINIYFDKVPVLISESLLRVKNENALMFKKSENQILMSNTQDNRYKTICVLLTNNGNMHYWGRKSNDRQLNCLTNVIKIVLTTNAFFALKKDYSVYGCGEYCWGHKEFEISTVPIKLFPNNNVVDICSTDFAVAFLKTDKTVSMSNENYVCQLNSGLTLNVKSCLVSVVKICSSHHAFAALKKNGKVICWGDPNFGGNDEHIRKELENIYEIQTREDGKGFIAFRKDGETFSW